VRYLGASGGFGAAIGSVTRLGWVVNLGDLWAHGLLGVGLQAVAFRWRLMKEGWRGELYPDW
jgi:hypothetical protein